MKITLDISKLLADGKISQQEFDRLVTLSTKDTASLAFNVLIAFGVLAISGGLLALFQSPSTSMLLGVGIGSLGLALGLMSPARWNILAAVCTLVGALCLGSGIVLSAKGSSFSFLLVAFIFSAAGVAARSGLLVSLAILAGSSSLGVRTGYDFASYFLGVEVPGITVVVFTGVAIATFLVSKVIPPDFSRLAIIAARTSVFMVNFGFWVGSLWGDPYSALWGNPYSSEGRALSETVFIVGWAVALLASGIWGALRNLRWVVNAAAVFGAIHLYTQWFERLGATPGAVVIAGLVAIAGALALWQVNNRAWGAQVKRTAERT